MQHITGEQRDPRHRPWSLAARLTLWQAGSAFLLVLISTGLLYWMLASHLDHEDDQHLAEKVYQLRNIVRSGADSLAALRAEVEPRQAAGQYAQFLVRIIGEDGRAIVETSGMSDDLPIAVFPPPYPVDVEPSAGVEFLSKRGRSYRLLAAATEPLAPQEPPPGQARDGARIAALPVALDCTYEEQLMAGYRRRLGLVLLLALVGCAAAGYAVARRSLRPVGEIADAAQRVRSTTLDERLSLAGLPDELDKLARTFNAMLDRLEDAFERLGRFSSDIAHELRTPVNNLRGEAEVALNRPRTAAEYRAVLESSLEECARLSKLIDSLLFLARAEHPETTIERQTVDVGKELAVVHDFYEAAAAEAGIELTVAAQAGATIDIDRTLFHRAIGNLVTNALAHTRAGGSITLSAAELDNAVEVAVTDTGAGIAPEHLNRVFDRFYHADEARSPGSGHVGLGLALVKSIAELHKGSARITSTVGKGTRVALVFPR